MFNEKENYKICFEKNPIPFILCKRDEKSFLPIYYNPAYSNNINSFKNNENSINNTNYPYLFNILDSTFSENKQLTNEIYINRYYKIISFPVEKEYIAINFIKVDSEEKNSLSMTNAGVASFRFKNVLEGISYVPGFCKLLGYERQEFDKIFYTNIKSFIYEKDIKRLFSLIASEILKTNKIDYSFRVIKKDGKIIWLRTTIILISIINGYYTFNIVFKDVTKQNQFFRNILNQTSQSIAIVSEKDSKVLYFNHPYQKRQKIFLDHILESEIIANKNIFDEQEIIEEIQEINENAFIQVRAKRTDYNNIPSIILFFSDITSIQKKQEKIQLLNDQLNGVINNVPCGIAVFYFDQKSFYPIKINEELEKLYNSKDLSINILELIANNNYYRIYEEDINKIMVEKKRIFHEKLTKGSLTYRMYDKNNNLLTMNSNYSIDWKSDKLGLLYCCTFNISNILDTKTKLEKTQKLLEAALDISKISIWQYDKVKKQIIQEIKEKSNAHLYGKVIEGIPNTIVDAGFIHPAFQSDYNNLFKEIDTTKDKVEKDILVKNLKLNKYFWKRYTLKSEYDKEGKYLTTIGISYDITKQKERERKYLSQISLMETKGKGLLASFLFNLDKKTINILSLDHKLYDLYLAKDIKNLFNNLGLYDINNIEPEEAQTKFSEEGLIDCYNKNINQIVFYCSYQKDEDILHLKGQINIIKSPMNKEIEALLMFYDKTEETILNSIIERAVSSEFDYIAYLDLTKDSFLVYRNEKSKAYLPQKKGKGFEEATKKHINTCVVEKERERVIKEKSISEIKRNLEISPIYLVIYTAYQRNGDLAMKKLAFSYLDKNKGTVLLTERDITDIHRLEKKKSEELEKALKQAQIASKAKNEFLSRISHDMRTPMNAIIGLSDIVLENDCVNNDLQLIKDIRESGKYLLSLINDILDMSKITNKKINLYMTPVQIDTFNDSIIKIIQPLIDQKEIDFEIKITGDDVNCIYLDRKTVKQVIINLLSNAIKFVGNKGKVKITINNKFIDKDNIHNTIIIEDNGIGMSEEFQKKLFLPFEQENIDNDPSRQGTGLGLSIVKNIIDLYKGTIDVESKKGQGTKFTINWDFKIAPKVELKPGSLSKDKKQLQNKRILICEDHPINAKVIILNLEKEGIITELAKNGEEGVQKFKDSPINYYATILMDLRMPILDGFEATRAIRNLNREDSQTVPIIAMTASVFEEDINKCKSYKMNAHLSKPINRELLFNTLKQFIE